MSDNTALQPGQLVRITTVLKEIALICEVAEVAADWLRVKLTKSTDSRATERLYFMNQIVFVDLVSDDEGQKYRSERDVQERALAG